MLFGSDPEVFVTDAAGKLLPAWSFLPGKKQAVQCEHVYSATYQKGIVSRNAGKAFWDGFQAEFSTNPQACLAYVPDNVRAGLLTTLRHAQKIEPRAKLSLQNVFQVPIATLRTESDEHVVLGCDPSFNAYHMSGEFPGDSRKLRYRFAGGHIHIEGVATEFRAGSKDLEAREKLAKPFIQALDKVLGVWAVGAAASFDNPIRRKYYGLAGEYRMPEYGVEYRTLSNFWLAHSAIVNLTFELTRSLTRAWAGHSNAKKALDAWVAHPQETVETINACDAKRAREILKRNAHLFEAIVPFGSKQALRVGIEGIESAIKDPEDFEKNWMLGDDSADWILHSDGKNMNWNNASYMMLNEGARL